MKAKVLADLVRSGKRPTVKLLGFIQDEGWGETGMLAEVTSVAGPDEDGVLVFRFDYNKFRETDLPLQSHEYWIKGNTKGTAFEAGMMKMEDISEDCYLDENEDLDLEVVESGILGEYIKSGATIPYVQWLEAKLEELVPDAMKDWKPILEPNAVMACPFCQGRIQMRDDNPVESDREAVKTITCPHCGRKVVI